MSEHYSLYYEFPLKFMIYVSLQGFLCMKHQRQDEPTENKKNNDYPTYGCTIQQLTRSEFIFNAHRDL